MSLAVKYKEQLSKFKDSVEKAKKWLAVKVKTLTGNEILNDRERLVAKSQLNQKLIGRMVMYYYDPKLKDVLPYYDRFPLAIIIKLNSKGFMALNLHYLPPDLRVKLLDGLMTIYKNKHLNEKKKLNLSYDLLRASSRTKYFAPCLKQYLYGHVRSKFYVVDPQEWPMVLTLPTERFVKKDKQFVWTESRAKLGIRTN